MLIALIYCHQIIQDFYFLIFYNKCFLLSAKRIINHNLIVDKYYNYEGTFINPSRSSPPLLLNLYLNKSSFSAFSISAFLTFNQYSLYPILNFL